MNWLLWNRGRILEGEGGDGGAGGGGAGDGGAGAAGGATLLSGAGGSGEGQGSSAGGQASATPSWVKDDGTFSEGWLDRLPEDLRGHAALKSLPSITDLAKSYVHTKGMVGKKLEAPGEGATPEQLAAWRKTVGAPETPEGYLGDAKTLRPEGIPENLWDAEGEKAFLALAHKHHLPPAAVKDILNHYGHSFTQGLEKNQQAEAAHIQAELGKLKGEWKDQFDANLQLAARAAKTAGLDPATNPIFQSAEVVQAFAKLGRMFNETSLVPGETVTAAGSIDARITEIQDPKGQSVIAREYRGEFGPERQQQAAEALRSLLKAKQDQTRK